VTPRLPRQEAELGELPCQELIDSRGEQRPGKIGRSLNPDIQEGTGHMAQQPLADVVKEALSRVHQESRIGRLVESPGNEPAVAPSDATEREYIQFLLMEVHALEALVVRLAREIDTLQAAG
jgi:hypothetical protein